MQEKNILSLGEKIYLRNDFGPISFGLAIPAFVVSWSDITSRDLLIVRHGAEIYLYANKELNDEEFNAEPVNVKALFNASSVNYPFPVDWNKDGKDDLIVTDGHGFLHLYERKGDFPDISFNYIETIKDMENGILFNIPYDNPTHETDCLGGYIDPLFFNFTFPLVYPLNNDINNKSVNLIIGDWSGNLWWMPDRSCGNRKPGYSGIGYSKPEFASKASYGREYLQKYGTKYTRPAEKICDENGIPFLLGDGIDGECIFKGSNVRPVLYKNDITGSDDLLIIAGTINNKIFYLKRVDKTEDRPFFRNMGEIRIDGLNIEKYQFLHSFLLVYNKDGWNDLLITMRNNIARLKNKRLGEIVPEFEFDGYISGKDVATYGDLYTEILRDEKYSKRYILDNGWYNWELREIAVRNEKPVLSSEKVLLEDQNGIFKVEGETDPQCGKEWGIHSAVRWNYDNSMNNHLIVGTDKGLLYLLVDEGNAGEGGKFKFKSAGPLKDNKGKIIKIHNRVCPAAIDLDGDGTEDLIVGGATYQMGVKTDPNPGGGIYYLLNRGIDKDGLPVLDCIKSLYIKGYEFNPTINNMVKVQAVDVDYDGEKEVIISVRSDGYTARVFKIMKNGIGLDYTGKIIPGMHYAEHLIDIDGDGKLELVFAGGKPGIAYYYKTLSINQKE